MKTDKWHIGENQIDICVVFVVKGNFVRLNPNLVKKFSSEYLFDF